MKYRVEKQSATVENLRETALTVSEDLELLDQYFRDGKSQPHGKHEWDDDIRPVISDAMQKLGETATWLADVPDKAVGDAVRAELRDALAPLSKDLTRFQELDSGEITTEARAAVRDGDEGTHEELRNEIEEMKQRREALNFLFGDRSWYDLFNFISETPSTVQKSRLKKKTIGRRTWNHAAAVTLRDQYGLIKDGEWGYELTDRGEAVLEAYHSIENNKYINDVARDNSTAETALYLLHGHFSADEWDDPEDL